ncbi:phosphotransferase [Patescibacteria group bacterium]|nr:phosphotransferase [Patescibacteria group bacterium]
MTSAIYPDCLQVTQGSAHAGQPSPRASQLREGIWLQNVLEENPDIDGVFLEDAVCKAEQRISQLPLVLSHGDLTPFNVMDKGVIDFEHRFIAPFGYDAVTAAIYQRFWDYPRSDQTGTMKRWEFSDMQIAGYLLEVDRICEQYNVPAVSEYFDDFLMLKSIWALSFEKTEDGARLPSGRWAWRKKITLYCAEKYLSGKPIVSQAFREIGLIDAPQKR